MKQKLNIVYDGPLDEEIDKVLEEAALHLGFVRWASGYCFPSKERDIAFEREVDHEQRNNSN